MQRTLIVSRSGQVTLPAAVRKHLGVEGGGVVLLEDRDHEVALKRDAACELELYSDEQMAAWIAADRLEDGERQGIVARLR